MKKRLFAYALALCLACSLCACGGSNNTPVEPPPPPPVEEVTPTDSSYPSDVNEPDISEPVESKPEEVKGLIFVPEVPTALPSYITHDVYCFDPETGNETIISSFTYPTDPTFDEYFSFLSGDRVCRESFSSDYSKMAVNKYIKSTNERHAGWIDTNGNFFDVTEALGLQAKSDFDDRANHRFVGFSAELFGFIDCGDDNEYYVPVNDVSPSTVKEGKVLEVGHPVNEHGCLLMDGHWGKYPINTVTSWIDKTRCIVNYFSGTYTRSDATSLIVDTATQTITEYIPGDSRMNWNGITSPDGTQIAFMSRLRGDGHTVDIYIVSVDGGDPVKVTGYSFALADITGKNLYQGDGYVLIDWV